MPFLGQDWRSPGDQWVRTGGGWEHLCLLRLKLFESLNENVLSRWVSQWTIVLSDDVDTQLLNGAQ